MDNYRKSVLPSGVTVCSEFIPSAYSVIIGVYITVGSRDEDDKKAGISHFTEHSVFKGTKKRNEREISLAIESRGGYLNASTSREWTSLYVHVLPEEVNLACDILADLIENPKFSEDALEAERAVILQEIKMFNDSPESLLFDYTFKSTFGEDHPLARLILGSIESVNNIKRKDVIDFWEKSWTAERIFVSAVGKVNHDGLYDLINKKIIKKKGSGITREFPSVISKKINAIAKPDLNHKYVALSFPSFSYNHELRFALLVAGTILGSGMSSLLFQRLRQDLSYVYEVSTFNEFFSDAGIFGIYFSTDENKLQDALNETRGLLYSLDFTEEEVATAKERLKGNIVISLESSGNRMERNVKEEICRGKRSTIADLLKKIEDVSMDEINIITKNHLKPDNFVLTVLGEEDNVSW
ncbi:insulinase family protein [candidate division WOR-3 bacterium]|nr:insulinase family protein [candidate division WOR-3 bacterium]